MANQTKTIKEIKKDLQAIGMFTSDQNKEIHKIKSEILMLSDTCKKEAAEFGKKFGNEWKNLASIQHTLMVINTNILLLNKKIELSETFNADIYERLTKLSELILATTSLDEAK